MFKPSVVWLIKKPMQGFLKWSYMPYLLTGINHNCLCFEKYCFKTEVFNAGIDDADFSSSI
jgi:hypothetical protein